MNVYFIEARDPALQVSWVKVGRAQDVRGRLKSIQCSCPIELSLLGTIPCASDKQAIYLEAKLHRSLDWHRVRGEWYVSPGDIERQVAKIIAYETRMLEKLPKNVRADQSPKPETPPPKSLWLTPKEVIGLTGRARHALQVEVLKAMKPPVYFRVRHEDQFPLVERWQFETDDA